MDAQLGRAEFNTNTYDSRSLFVLTSSPDSFSQRMPRELKETVQMLHVSPDVDSSVVGGAMIGIRDNLDHFFEKGHRVVLQGIYSDWVRNNNYTSVLPETTAEFMKHKITLKNVQVIPKLEDLAIDEQEKWNTFLMVGNIDRQSAVELVKRLIGLIEIPDIHNIADPGVTSLETLRDKLITARKKIIIQIFPDLTDEEAKSFFGQLTTAKEILETKNHQPEKL